ncbi:MAG: hypothetical protein NXI04_05740 [Planctomycetaceae bacterium]|nr:hypothetical protein [Planctomycetaceae bacterium]
MKRVMRKLLDAVRAWYRIDQVRIAPSDGRLLQLDVGDQFVLFDDLFVVQQRSLKSSEACCEVDLTLAGEHTTAILHVQRRHLTEPICARLCCRDSSRAVFDGDVLLLPGEGCSSSTVHSRRSAGRACDEASSGASSQFSASFPSVDNPLPAFRVS